MMFYRDQDGKLLRDQSSKVIDCPQCPPCGGGIPCAANPDSALASNLNATVQFCGNSYTTSPSDPVEYFEGVWRHFTEFTLVQTENYWLVITDLRLVCCDTPGVFFVLVDFTLLKWDIFAPAWNIIGSGRTAVNYGSSGGFPQGCDTSDPPYDPNASFTINDTNPFDGTYEFHPKLSFFSLPADWAAACTEFGCATDDEVITIHIY